MVGISDIVLSGPDRKSVTTVVVLLVRNVTLPVLFDRPSNRALTTSETSRGVLNAVVRRKL